MDARLASCVGSGSRSSSSSSSLAQHVRGKMGEMDEMEGTHATWEAGQACGQRGWSGAGRMTTCTCTAALQDQGLHLQSTTTGACRCALASTAWQPD